MVNPDDNICYILGMPPDIKPVDVIATLKVPMPIKAEVIFEKTKSY